MALFGQCKRPTTLTTEPGSHGLHLQGFAGAHDGSFGEAEGVSYLSVNVSDDDPGPRPFHQPARLGIDHSRHCG